MRALAIALLAALVAACASGPTVTSGPTLTATTGPTEAPATTPPPVETLVPSATLGPDETPGPTVIDLLPLLTSELTVANLADQPLTLGVTLLDTESDDEFVVGTFELQPLQVTIQSVVPARFRLEFVVDSSPASTCTIDIADGEALQFAVTGTGVAMTSSAEAEPEDPAQMLVATAARCRAGVPT